VSLVQEVFGVLVLLLSDNLTQRCGPIFDPNNNPPLQHPNGPLWDFAGIHRCPLGFCGGFM